MGLLTRASDHVSVLVRGLHSSILPLAAFFCFVLGHQTRLDAQTGTETVLRHQESCDRVELYHPLIPGSRWIYRVEEGSRTYEQSIELHTGPIEGTFVLATSSPNRRSRYLVSNHDGAIVLHQVKARPGILPLWRTLRFEPPLPFLSLQHGLTGCWTWTGRSDGFGPEIETVNYSIRPVDDDQGSTNEGRLEVVAISATQNETVAEYRALYAERIGLVRVDGQDYRKYLLEHHIP